MGRGVGFVRGGRLVPMPARSQEVPGSNPNSVAGGHQKVNRCTLRTV